MSPNFFSLIVSRYLGIVITLITDNAYLCDSMSNNLTTTVEISLFVEIHEKLKCTMRFRLIQSLSEGSTHRYLRSHTVT